MPFVRRGEKGYTFLKNGKRNKENWKKEKNKVFLCFVTKMLFHHKYAKRAEKSILSFFFCATSQHANLSCLTCSITCMKQFKTFTGYEASVNTFTGTVALVSYRNISENRASGLFWLYSKAEKTFSPSLTNVSINTYDTDFRSGVFESIITKRENFNSEYFKSGNLNGFDGDNFSNPNIFMGRRNGQNWSKGAVCSIVSLTVVIVGLIVASIVWATEWVNYLR